MTCFRGLYFDCGVFGGNAFFREGEADFSSFGIPHDRIAIFVSLVGVTIVFQCRGYIGTVGLFH